MFSNLLVLDTYTGPFVGRDEVQTLVDPNNQWFWAHRISQIYRLSTADQQPLIERGYGSGSGSPCAFIPLFDNESECKTTSSEDADDSVLANDSERSLRFFFCPH